MSEANKDATRERIQTVGVVAGLSYMLIPQVRTFVNEKTEAWFGGTTTTTTDTTTTTTEEPAV